jgi:histidine triad (HIT) family protein
MDCLFCQISAGVVRADLVHEGRTAIAFLERNPASPGETLLAPRPHVPSLMHLDEGAAGSFFASLVEVTERVEEVLHPAALEVRWIQPAHGAGPGGDPGHFHARLVPRYRVDVPAALALERAQHLAAVVSALRARRRSLP